MRKTAYLLLSATLFLSGASFAFAASSVVDDLSNTTTPQPFSFVCNPYISAFANDEAYAPAEDGTCVFAIPQTEPVKLMAIYQGTPGNATLTNFGYVSGDPNQVFDMPNSTFAAGSPQPGDEFFSVSVGGSSVSDISNADVYFRTGAGTPPTDYSMVTWYWSAPATVTADNQTINAGDPLPPLTATISGFVDGDTFATSGITGSASCSTTATTVSPAGDYSITCTIGTLSSEKYEFDTFVAGDLHIAPAVQPTQSPLTVTANSLTVQLGSPLPALTATLSGFLGTDTAGNSTTGAASCSTTATNSSAVGSYPITCTVGTLASTKYTFTTFVAGTLHIVDTTAPTVTITTPPNGHQYFRNDTVVAAATATDLSPIATTVYKFNGTVVTATQPLPFSSAPTGTSTNNTLVVAATDAFGNTGYATSTFTIVPPDLNPPTITILTPEQFGLYLPTDTVFVTANITDQSPIAATTYWFNGTKINPANALPLSTLKTPSLQKVSVSATDIHGNTATSTTAFILVKTKNSCLTDIVSALILITQDKTLPSKPAITQLIQDCSALLQGYHSYNDQH